MKNLESHIKQSGLTVEQIAEKVGVAPSTIYRAIGGRTEIRLSTLTDIATVLGVSVGELIGDSQAA